MNREEVGRAVSSVLPTLRYKPGWQFKLAGPLGRYVCIYAHTPDSHHPEQYRTTQHQFELPESFSDRRAMLRWLFDCLLLCELHECGEFYEIDGFRPYYPNHQDEGSPYVLVERMEP